MSLRRKACHVFSCGSSLSLEGNLTISKPVTLIFSIYAIWVGELKTRTL